MPRMRTRGHGTIEMHRGKPRVRLTLPDGTRPAYPIPDGVDAETYRAALVERLAGTTDDPMLGGQTLGAWAVTWLDEREKTHRDAAGDRQRWGAYLAGTPLASVRLDALMPSHVLKWARAIVKRPARNGGTLARQTAMNAWTTLRACLRDAMAAERVNPDRVGPILVLDLPTSPIGVDVEMDERIEWLRGDEIDRVLALSLTDDQRSAFVVGLYTAMREGELHGLDWCRVLWDERCVVVARSRKGATKAGKVARVPLLAPAYDALRTRWEAAGKPARGLVWPAEHGGCHARGFDWGWSDHKSKSFVKFGLRRLARIARPATFNDATRHTCAVHLLRGSWAPSLVPRAYRMEEVSRWLRHSSLAVTEKHYAALTLDALPVSVPAERPQPPARAFEIMGARENRACLPMDYQAAHWNRTSDLRFTKPSGTLAISRASDALGALRAEGLNALVGVARGGPMEALVDAVRSMLEHADAAELALSDSTGEFRSTHPASVEARPRAAKERA
jgi:integrase